MRPTTPFVLPSACKTDCVCVCVFDLLTASFFSLLCSSFSRMSEAADKEKEAKKERTVVDDKDRHKPFGKTAWTPVDDVYFMRYYPRTLYGAADAVDLLKDLQKLDFTPQRQPVYIDLRLDMKLEKKVSAYRVDSFVSTVHLPHPFKTEKNTVLVFTEDPLQAQVAKDSGAAFAGGAELVQSILDDEVSADFYVAVPDMLPKLLLLKNKLRKKFPKSKRGSVGVHIPKMVSLFQTGHEVTVEDERYVRTQIGLLDMPTEELLSNLQTVLLDVCSHRPAGTGTSTGEHLVDLLVYYFRERNKYIYSETEGFSFFFTLYQKWCISSQQS
uniref:Large ribosomal subunit protein uL1m n=1 Tax=Cyclopterus lumpus TaxID=8103 RepID=A0A8C2XDU0_CYCLU